MAIAQMSRIAAFGVCVAMFLASRVALAQSPFPAVFVANDGNLEGSVSSFRILDNGAVSFVGELNTTTNAYSIALSPNGRYLAVTHATAATIETITMLQIAADATLSLVGTFPTPDSPLDCRWLRDDLLAVTLTNISLANKVILYRFTASTPSLVELHRYDTGSFNSYLAVHPNGQTLYTQDSTAGQVYAWHINSDDTLTQIDQESTAPAYALWMEPTHDGSKLYVAGGASSGDEKINGFHIAADGTLTPMAANPIVVSNSSPKVLAVSGDDAYLLVGYARRTEVRSYAIDPVTGALDATGNLFSFAGIQGDLGSIGAARNLAFAVDRYTSSNGLRGLFALTVGADGSLAQNGSLVDTQGVTPDRLVIWDPPPACPDLNGDHRTDESDLGLLLQSWQAGPGGDLNGDGQTNESDLGLLLQGWQCGV
ncbi:MAG: beta-propeller fold lactonase family protein [Phycisphaerae bacterium]